MADDEEVEGPQIKPFAQVLQEMERGRFHDEAGELLAELTRKVREEGKPGTFTITLKITPMSRTAGAVEVAGDITIKAPKPPRDTVVFFDDEQGNLLRDHPTDKPFPAMRAVDVPLTKEGTNE